jgi:hypothetical protein
MREDEILANIIEEIESATPDGVGVRTDGGDVGTAPPEAIIIWNADRLDGENGHKSFGDYVTDNAGNNIGVEYHSYWRMELDIQLRYYEEVVKDQVMHDIQMHLLPFEDNPSEFHKDTYEWVIGTVGPRNQPMREPDWYSTGIQVVFEYIKRTEETRGDAITDIENDVEITEIID